METLWFWIVAVMVTMYVILDGFDIGAGVLHLALGKSDRERRLILRSIGPVWDGNEVWLLAAGGTLYFAFPLLYASSFSGFYLPLMMVLWLLMGRAIGVELRNHVDQPVWRSMFDAVFALSSTLLAIFFGAALGNVIRGVPLQADGYFFEPLWTTFRVTPQAGILDWYTVMAGVVALAVLAQHGALYIATKTEDELNARARRAAAVLWPVVLALTFLSLVATMWIRPEVAENYRKWPAGLLIPTVVFAALTAMLHFRLRRRDKPAFLASCAYIAFMLVGAAFALYPNVLPASTGTAYNLTIHNTAAGSYGLKIGLVWWTMGMILATAYFVFVYRMFRGKVTLESEG